MKSFAKTILSPFVRLYEKSAFSDKWYGIFFNPFYFARSGLFRNIRFFGKDLTGTVLDVGAGTMPYKNLLSCKQYISLEYDTPENRASKRADYFYNGNSFPFPDEAFDAVLCTQVLEHVPDPQLFIREIRRVLRPDGKLLLTVPFIWNEHECPFDFFRY